MSISNTNQATAQLAGFFRALSQPTRIEILLAIGSEEACVCHLEAVLGQRQAYISQHLMGLRDAGVIDSRREGRFIFYRLADEKMIPLIQDAAKLLGIDPKLIDYNLPKRPHPGCCCPQCAPESSMIQPEAVLDPQSLSEATANNS